VKPLYLSIQAFGPFAALQTIDFSLLDNRSLFLIHGNTGSGKTTILDAICFALYGELSGRDRDAYRMRSDFSDESLQTEVSLSFSLGKDIYKVNRIPEQERSKRRGTGTTSRPSSATLWKLDNQSIPSAETVLADKWSRVTEKVESLLGFRSDQFRQVVVLPQGDFRRLLSANSQERQEILTTLFKTGRYRLFEDELREMSKRLKTQYDQLSFELKILYQETFVSTPDEISAILLSVTNDISFMSKDYSDARVQEQSLLEKISEIKAINARFKELSDSQAEFESLSSQKDHFEELSSQLLLIEKSLIHKSLLDQISQINNDLLSVRSRISHTEERYLQVNNDCVKAADLLENALKQQSEREKLLNDLNTLHQIEPKLAKFEELRISSDNMQKKVNDLQLLRDNNKVHLDKVRTALENINNTIVKLRESALLSDTHKQNFAEISRYSSDIDKLNRLEKDKSRFISELAAAQADYASGVSEIDKNKETLESILLIKERFQAASLAKSLADNAPCPVCGSLAHPSPAQSSEHLPDDKTILTLKERLKKLEKERDLKRNSIESFQIKISTIANEMELIDKSLEKCPSRTACELDILLDHHKKCAAESADAAARLDKSINDKSRGEAALAKTEKELEKNSDDFTAATAEFSSVQATLKTFENDIPDEFRSLTILTSAIKGKEKAIIDLDTKIENARKNHNTLNEQKISLAAELNELRSSFSELSIKYTNASETFTKNIAADGFTDKHHYDQCLLKSQSISSEKNKIHTFQLSLHAAEERFKRAAAECRGLAVTDTGEYDESCRVIQTRIETLTNSIAALRQKHDMLKGKLTDIVAINDKITKIEQQYGIAAKLSDVASGSNALRMTFERFILASLLDDVLYAGSHRLKIMSRGRFELHRAQTAGDMRSSGGLDLQVLDSYTGTFRPVSSLSGGEGFLAALSLALGLADVVQSHSGGIRLETIFIDEGFGSLDSEALDLAFAALADLGQGGRLVGIISHVAELRERIETRLEVSSGRSGSTARFNR